MNTIIKTSMLSLALAVALHASSAAAQDSGTGIDFGFGSTLDPTGGAHSDCDPRGSSWLSGERKRTPAGALYVCAPDILERRSAGDWTYSGSIGIGWMFTGGDDHAPNFQRFNAWDHSNALAAFGLEMVRPYDGTYVEVRAAYQDRDKRYVKANVGRAGKYKVEAFAKSQPNVMSTQAHSIWDGVGSNRLTLAGGLVPGASTVDQVKAVSAASPERYLQVTRDKQGLGINYFFDKRWTGYFNATSEERKGARAFGGPYFFNFAFPSNGGAYETPRPIDDSTVNLTAGLRFIGNKWRMDLAYNGSFYRDRHDEFTYEVPFGLWPVVPGAVSVAPSVGSFAMEPDNDYHNLRLSLSRKLSRWNGEWNFGASGGFLRQNESLLAPIDCEGSFGIDLSPTGSPVNPFLFDCDNWNTTAALSRQNADMRIDTGRADTGLVLQPTQNLTLRAQAKWQREDYRNVYLAYNPLTGQYGYIAENGAMGAVVPGEMGIFDPIGGASTNWRIRSLPLDKETREFNVGSDYRIGLANTLGATFTHTEVKRTNREMETVKTDSVKLTWANRALEWLGFRANYQYLDLSGSVYNYDPYEFTFSAALPGFVHNDEVIVPHTVEALRKYDVGTRKEQKFTLIATVVPHPDMSINATVRGDFNDYDAELGRQKYDTFGFSLSWDWQPSTQTNLSTFVAMDRARLDIANVNETATAPNDPALGGSVYTEAGRWWVDDTQRNKNYGATFAHDFGRMKLDVAWNLVDTGGTTDFRYNSAAALAWPALAQASGAGNYAPLRYRVNALDVGLNFALNPRTALRVFNRLERGRISDWHYEGLEDGLVVDHRVYLDGGQIDYSASLWGMMLEVKL